jgi:hypothetical protein
VQVGLDQARNLGGVGDVTPDRACMDLRKRIVQ